MRLDCGMAKPIVPASLLQAIRKSLPVTGAASEAGGTPAARKEADPRSGATEIQSIRPARTAIAHQRGGNKGR